MAEFDKNKTYALFDTPLNKKRISTLQKEEIKIIIFPTISTTGIDCDDAILQNLNNFDWLVFPDVYTVEYFIVALEKLEVDLFDLDQLRVLAYGEAVSDRLRFSQLHADVIPSSIRNNDVLQALKDYVFDEIDNLRILILEEKDTEVEIAKLFSNVTELSVYSFGISDKNQIPKLKALLKGGAIDEFIFSSHYDVLNLAQLFQTENLAELLEGIKLTVIGNSTLQSLQEFRLI